MSPFDYLVQSLTVSTFNPWFLVKLLLLFALLIYVAFAVIVVRQVTVMSRSLAVSFNAVLKLVAWIHLGVAVGIWLLAWSIL